MTDEEAIKIAVNIALEADLFPAKVFVPNVPWESDPPPTRVFLIEVGRERRPFVVGRIPYQKFKDDMQKLDAKIQHGN